LGQIKQSESLASFGARVTLFLLERPWRGYLFALVSAVVVWAGISAAWPRFFSAINEQSAALVWRLSDPLQLERRIVLVDIDERSLQELGPWPWPRDRIVQLIKALDQQAVGLKLFDIVFADPKADDELLARAFRAPGPSPNVPAQVFSLNPDTPVATGTPTGALSLPICPPFSANAHGHLANHPNLGPAGHITPRIDPDGAVRKVPALVCSQGAAFPALALAGLNRLSGDQGFEYRPAASLWESPWTLTIQGLAGIRVPIDGQGDMRVSFRLPRSAFLSVSAADVLAGRAPQELLKGAWVIVGATAFGIGDAVPTPHGGAVSGLEVHAQLMAALLDDRLPYTPIIAPYLMLLLSTLGVGLMLLASRQAFDRFSKLSAMTLPAIGAGFAALIFSVHGLLLLGLHWFVGWADTAFFVLLSSLLMAFIGHGRVRLEAGRVFGQLVSHLPREVAEQVALAQTSGSVQSSRKDVTVLYADLRNFSAFCEKQPAAQAAEVLHQFFITATEIVEANGGVIEHMVGDSVLAVWNGPKPCEQHPQRALLAAQELWQRCEGQLGELVLPEAVEPLDIGIGMESGEATIGLFGPANRRTHTVLGETVTVAVQLQGLTADLACPILVSEGLANRVSAQWVNMGYFLLPGLVRSRRVYSLPILSPRQQQDRLKLLSIDRPAAA